MNDIFFYSIIFILLAGFLCGGILGSIIIRRITQMKEMLHVYCLTERQSRGRCDFAAQQQTIELTQEERSMLLEDFPREEQEKEIKQKEELVIEEFLQEILSC